MAARAAERAGEKDSEEKNKEEKNTTWKQEVETRKAGGEAEKDAAEQVLPGSFAEKQVEEKTSENEEESAAAEKVAASQVPQEGRAEQQDQVREQHLEEECSGALRRLGQDSGGCGSLARWVREGQGLRQRRR